MGGPWARSRPITAHFPPRTGHMEPLGTAPGAWGALLALLLAAAPAPAALAATTAAKRRLARAGAAFTSICLSFF